MILPIRAFGDPVLRKETEEVEEGMEGLEELVENMFETMYAASGVGLAAPQIGQALRLFIVDASPFAEDGEEGTEHLKDFKKVFINPEIVEEEGEEWEFAEGCLSIPTIREGVMRMPNIKLKYQDMDFKEHVLDLDGYAARVIQHEFDHLNGVLFTDHLNPLRKRLLKRKLTDISKGKVEVAYKMKFPQKKR